MADDADISLEVALEELEGIVQVLEAGRLPLEESLELFERGTRLIRLSNAMLEKAERRIEVLTGELPEDLSA